MLSRMRPEEKATLIEKINECRSHTYRVNWSMVRQRVDMPVKTMQNIYFTYQRNNRYRLNIIHHWTEKEEEKLYQLQAYGLSWQYIQLNFDDLSVNQLKNKFQALQKKRALKAQCPDDVVQLIMQVMY